MKEKTICSYSEYKNIGGGYMDIVVREDGGVSYRYGYRKRGGKSKKRRSKIKQKRKTLHVYKESHEGSRVMVSTNINCKGEIGDFYFSLQTKEDYYKYTKRSLKKNPMIICKSQAKRRNLGFNPLNKIFPHSNGHHIDKRNVLYIPATLHNSVRHNVFSGKGMKEINDLAFQWVAMQENFFFLKEKEGNVNEKKK